MREVLASLPVQQNAWVLTSAKQSESCLPLWRHQSSSFEGDRILKLVIGLTGHNMIQR